MTDQPPIVALPTRSEEDNVWRGLVEAVPLHPFIQCQHVHARGAQSNSAFWRNVRIEQNLDPDYCGRPARIRMGGHLFCAQHAGIVLLDLALAHAFDRNAPLAGDAA